ncbi:MAG: hypothetical protein NT150_00385 [Bacteroidetes bacterium]|nr:hypothetical protein [Bacteroidota bacterium]
MRTLFYTLLMLTMHSVNAQQNGVFNIFVRQGKTPIKVREGDTIKIKRQEFTLIFELDTASLIGFNASENDTIYKLFTVKKDLNSVSCFGPGTGYAEYLKNKGNSITVGDYGQCYWYYDSPKDHRFNSVKIEGRKMTCERKIKNLFYAHLNADYDVISKDLPVEKSTDKRIYCCLYKRNDSSKSTTPTYFIIEFID